MGYFGLYRANVGACECGNGNVGHADGVRWELNSVVSSYSTEILMTDRVET